MTFYLIGLGLNLKSISLESLEICKTADKIYLESYTVNFPYSFDELEKIIGKKIIILKREDIESEEIITECKTKNIVMLVYGSPLIATTHISLILRCKKDNIDFEIIENASIFDAIAETGLQNYKFGRTSSLPAWKKNYSPDSFIETIKNNQKIKAHSLLLSDISLEFKNALEQIETSFKKNNLEIEKIIVCSNLGSQKRKIFYNQIENLKNKKIEMPFCFIIPSDLHFLEEEFLNKIKF